MKIRAIALNTFAGLLRNRLLLLFLAIFVCVVLLMTTPLLMAKAMTSQQQGRTMVLALLSTILSMVSGFGSLLAAWASADALSSEMRSGTIFAVMARPVRRWQFLLGKYLGVMILMAIYVLSIVVLTHLLAWIGGERIVSSPWVLVVYPLVRYAMYAAIAMLLATVAHPVVSLGAVLVLAVASSIVAPAARSSSYIAGWIREPLRAVLPSTGLLSETRFLVISSTSLKATPWTDHLVALGHGLDYALVCFLLAVWIFNRLSLSRT